MHMNRLLCISADEEGFARAACGEPSMENGKGSVLTAAAEKWHLREGGIPADIPVLPETQGEPVVTELLEYASCLQRITLIPRSK